jgi:hypothetical protein
MTLVQYNNNLTWNSELQVVLWGVEDIHEDSFRHRVQVGSGTHPASYPVVPVSLSLGLKWPGLEANHSAPYSAQVENAWSYKSTPPYVFKVQEQF